MNKYYFWICTILFVGCKEHNATLEDFTYSVINYNDLPEELQKFLNNWRQYEIVNDKGINLGLPDIICLDKLYSLNVVDTWYGPWTSHFLLQDEKGFKIRIEFPQSTPFIIFEKNLYICSEYNFLQYSNSNYSAMKFVRYSLSD